MRSNPVKVTSLRKEMDRRKSSANGGAGDAAGADSMLPRVGIFGGSADYFNHGPDAPCR